MKDYSFRNHYKGHWDWVVLILLVQWSVTSTQHLGLGLATIMLYRGLFSVHSGNKICLQASLVAGEDFLSLICVWCFIIQIIIIELFLHAVSISSKLYGCIYISRTYISRTYIYIYIYIYVCVRTILWLVLLMYYNCRCKVSCLLIHPPKVRWLRYCAAEVMTNYMDTR